MFADAVFPDPFFSIIIAALLVILIFEIFMFIHVINNEAINTNAKMLWILGMFFIHPFVAIVYYFTDYNKAK